MKQFIGDTFFDDQRGKFDSLVADGTLAPYIQRITYILDNREQGSNIPLDEKIIQLLLAEIIRKVHCNKSIEQIVSKLLKEKP